MWGGREALRFQLTGDRPRGFYSSPCTQPRTGGIQGTGKGATVSSLSSVGAGDGEERRPQAAAAAALRFPGCSDAILPLGVSKDPAPPQGSRGSRLRSERFASLPVLQRPGARQGRPLHRFNTLSVAPRLSAALACSPAGTPELRQAPPRL